VKFNFTRFQKKVHLNLSYERKVISILRKGLRIKVFGRHNWSYKVVVARAKLLYPPNTDHGCIMAEQSISASNPRQSFPGIRSNRYRQIKQERLRCKAKGTRWLVTYLGLARREVTQDGLRGQVK
jgi:hypothetical protein